MRFGRFLQKQVTITDNDYISLLKSVYGTDLKEVRLLQNSTDCILVVALVSGFNVNSTFYASKFEEIEKDLPVTSTAKSFLIITFEFADYYDKYIPFYNTIRKCKIVWQQEDHSHEQ